MTKIVSSGTQGGGPIDAGRAGRAASERSRQARSEDRPKGTGTRDAGLQYRPDGGAGGGSGPADDPRVQAFGTRLDRALNEPRGREPARKSRERDEGESEVARTAAMVPDGLGAPPGSPPSPLAAGAVPARTVTDRATSLERRAGLTALWIADPKADARPGAAAPADRDGGPNHPTVSGEAPRSVRLLAEAGPADGAGAAAAAVVASTPFGAGGLPAAAATVPGQPTAAGADRPATSVRVAAIAERIERVIEAEDAPKRGEPFTIDIPLDLGGPGLHGVTVTVGPAGLDIVLARAATPAAPDLEQAARALADRLQQRFPRSLVRVHESAGSVVATATSSREDGPVGRTGRERT